MIRINLLPEGSRKSQIPWARDLPWRKLAIGAGGLWVLVAVWMGAASRLEIHAHRKLSAEWERLKPQRDRLEKTRASVNVLKNRQAVYTTLKAPESRWSRRLNLLSDCLVSQLWFTSLKGGSSLPELGTAPGRTALLLKGSSFLAAAGEGAPVARYLQRLKEHPEFGRLFSGIELKGVEQRQVEQEEVGDFVIVLYPHP